MQTLEIKQNNWRNICMQIRQVCAKNSSLCPVHISHAKRQFYTATRQLQ